MILSAQIIKKACKKSGLSCQSVSSDEAVIKIDIGGKPHFTYNFSLGLISNSQSKICHDKSYQYQLLRDFMPMPKMANYIDPTNDQYKKFALEKSVEEITKHITKDFNFPVIIKKNRGERGTNVFLCHDNLELEHAVTQIYDKKSSHYDHVLLAQNYVKPRSEYRVIIFERKVELIYEKVGPSPNPLRDENSETKIVKNKILEARLGELTEKLIKVFPVKYAGLDIIEDESGKLWLIEINADPGYGHFVRDNGEELVVNLFSKIFSFLAGE